jgi:uncharacterized lipoprotein
MNSSSELPDLRNCLLRLAITALSVAACSSVHRVPKTAPTTANSPAPPVFTSRNGPPTSFVHSNSDARTTRVIVVRHGLSKEALFRMATDYLKTKYTIYVSDPTAGFLMTNWQSSFVRDSVPELRYRTRVILKFLGEDWRQLDVTSEANWLRGEEWDVGYDAALLDSVSTQLTTRLGPQP